MIPEIGVFSLVVALLIALVQGSLPLAGAHLGITSWIRVARPAALGLFAFAMLAFGCLAWSFLDNDFSVLYVASNSHADLPAGPPHRETKSRWPRRRGSSATLWTLSPPIRSPPSRTVPSGMPSRTAWS